MVGPAIIPDVLSPRDRVGYHWPARECRFECRSGSEQLSCPAGEGSIPARLTRDTSNVMSERRQGVSEMCHALCVSANSMANDLA
jgi:hypothetical protein